MTMIYGGIAGSGGTHADSQLQPYLFERKALVDLQQEMFFTQLADITNMPKNYGKEIKFNHYIPLIDDRNVNDQGIDANGVTISPDTYVVRFTSLSQTLADDAAATAAADAINVVEAGVASAAAAVVTVTKLQLVPTTLVLATAVTSATPYASATRQSGNLYGSSKDIGFIAGKLPLIGELGGRVNRVGYTRKVLSGSFANFGFFDEYSADHENFDSDAQLLSHYSREMMNGAVKVYEDMLQMDLLSNAQTIRYTGSAISNATVSATSVVTYQDLMRLSIELDNNRTDRKTKMIKGTQLTDTVTLDSCRVMYVGSELIPTLEAMVDLHGERAFVPARKYASGTTLLAGERGAIADFRIIVVPSMSKWAGAGATATDASFYASGNKYDVFPMLVVGNESFTTIGFQSSKGAKFETIYKKPSRETATENDPYGKKGFHSIQWWYGFMAQRPERIAVIKTAARM